MRDSFLRVCGAKDWCFSIRHLVWCMLMHARLALRRAIGWGAQPPICWDCGKKRGGRISPDAVGMQVVKSPGPQRLRETRCSPGAPFWLSQAAGVMQWSALAHPVLYIAELKCHLNPMKSPILVPTSSCHRKWVLVTV